MEDLALAEVGGASSSLPPSPPLPTPLLISLIASHPLIPPPSNLSPPPLSLAEHTTNRPYPSPLIPLPSNRLYRT